jgi:hypothetical protein
MTQVNYDEYRNAVATLLDSRIDKRLIYALTDYIANLDRRLDSPDAVVMANPAKQIIMLAYDPFAYPLRAEIETVLSYMDSMEAKFAR